MKIELNLAKAVTGKWPTFGEEKPTKPEGFIPSQPTKFEDADPATKPTPPTQSKAPAYPTSSKTGPKDWDKFDANEDNENDGDPNAFFQQLYAGASPDAQRAMLKSFQESNGTALSTDWESVSKETVKTMPPDGMEVKKW